MNQETVTHLTLLLPLPQFEMTTSFILKPDCANVSISQSPLFHNESQTSVVGSELSESTEPSSPVSSVDTYLRAVMALYHTEPDPEAFTEKYQEIADRYPTLARSPEPQLLDIQPPEPESHTEPTSSGLASVALALLAGKSKNILPAILAISLALAACSEAATPSTPDFVSPPTPIVQPLTPSPVRPTPETVTTTMTPPTLTPEPTETPAPVETYFSHDTVNGAKIQELMDASGIRVTGSNIDFPGLIDPVKNPNGILHVQELDRNLLARLAPFIQADGTLKLPDEVVSFTWRFRWQEDTGNMVPELFFTTTDGKAIILSDDGRTLIRGELIGDVLVPTLKDGRVIEVTPPYVAPPTSQPREQATNVPPAQGTEAPPVVSPTSQPEQPPAAGFHQEGDNYVCKCPWTDPRALFINPQFRFLLNIWDKADLSKPVYSNTFFPGQEDEFDNKVQEYLNNGQGYHLVGTLILQHKSFGDPAITYQPGSAIYTLNNK